MFADFPVCVTCKTCRHFCQLHAFKLIQQIGKKGRGEAFHFGPRFRTCSTADDVGGVFTQPGYSVVASSRIRIASLESTGVD